MASDTPPTGLPAAMHVWHRPSRGPFQTHLLHSDKHAVPPLPAADSSDVLIRVSYVALEYAMGLMLPLIPSLPFIPPFIPELEFSGTVVAAGSKAPTDVREVGTRVMGFQTLPAIFLRGGGALAEYVSISGGLLARIPDAMTGDRGMEEAAGLIGGGATALKMVRTARIKAGDRVLVNGASGAVGNMVVQLAHERGAQVVGVASGGNEELVRGVGADEFIDYTLHSSLAGHLTSAYGSRPLDHILDCVGHQDLYCGSPAYLKEQGEVINVGAMVDGIWSTSWNWFRNTWSPVWLGGTPRRYIMFSTVPSRDDAVYLLRLVEEGKLKVQIDKVWDMKDAIGAYERVASKRARGKVVIKVKED